MTKSTIFGHPCILPNFQPQCKTKTTSKQEVSQCLTCQVFQAELAKAGVAITSVIEKDGEGIAIFIQFSTADDPQVLQRQVVKLVQGH